MIVYVKRENMGFMLQIINDYRPHLVQAILEHLYNQSLIFLNSFDVCISITVYLFFFCSAGVLVSVILTILRPGCSHTAISVPSVMMFQILWAGEG